MRVNWTKRQITLKIVYYGPGLSGKTTNLVQLHERFNQAHRGALLQLDTHTERTLFFDYFPVVVGKISGMKVKVDFFTVPGQSFYTATRKAVLDGCDGIVFVADSSARREDANQLSRDDMVNSLVESGRSLDEVPHVYQWNKRDADDALDIGLLQRQLNPEGAPAVEAIAPKGEGVWEAHNLILSAVFESVRRNTRQGAVSNG